MHIFAEIFSNLTMDASDRALTDTRARLIVTSWLCSASDIEAPMPTLVILLLLLDIDFLAANDMASLLAMFEL